MKKGKIKIPKNLLEIKKKQFYSIEKEEIEKLNGGHMAFSDGCTDGCGPIFGSFWNCTKADCTNNCSHTFCPEQY